MKKTLITLVITGIVSSMLIGCSQGTEGNATNAATPEAASLTAPTGAPATDATNATPAPADSNK